MTMCHAFFYEMGLWGQKMSSSWHKCAIIISFHMMLMRCHQIKTSHKKRLSIKEYRLS